MSLMTLLPDYYKGNQTMEELQSILSKDINHLAAKFDETIDQCFVNTATALLSRYEKIHGIQVDVSKTDEFRRERIRAKIRGTGTVTKQMIKDVAKSYSSGEVEVLENPSECGFIIRFVGTKGIPANMGDLILTIEEIKPAHLVYEFQYIYNTWSMAKTLTWNEASTRTWKRLREEDIN